MDAGEAVAGPVWFRRSVAGWLQSLVRKRRSPATRTTYITPLRRFGLWLEAEDVAAGDQLDRFHLQRWQDSLVDAVGAKSQSVYATAVRGWLRWAGREGHVTPGLAEWVELVDVPHHDPLVLEPEQLGAVVDRYRRPRGDLAYLRDRALFWFMITSSARISEVLSLDRRQLDRRRWVVVQKGGGQKALVISRIARQWLDQYLSARGRDDEPALWVYEGPRVGRRRLRRAQANAIWRRLCAELGIEPFTNRWLRGTSATELNELNATAVDIAHHLGHANLATVHKYADVRGRRRQEMVDGLDQLVSPRATPRSGRSA